MAKLMASKKTLNAKNLEALGARRLAELLIEISTGNTMAKRRLRLELAGEESPDAVAGEIRKRLATINRSREFVDWQNRRALVDDLQIQRRAIVDKVAKRDPSVGLELMWRFMTLAGSVFERCDDGHAITSPSTLMMGNGNADQLRRAAEPLVERRQGQAAPEGYFQIGGIVDGQLKPACEIEDQRSVVLIVNRNTQLQTIGQRVRHLLSGNPAAALVHQQSIAQFVPPDAWSDPTPVGNALHGVNGRGFCFVAQAPSEEYGVVDDDGRQ